MRVKLTNQHQSETFAKYHRYFIYQVKSLQVKFASKLLMTSRNWIFSEKKGKKYFFCASLPPRSATASHLLCSVTGRFFRENPCSGGARFYQKGAPTSKKIVYFFLHTWAEKKSTVLHSCNRECFPAMEEDGGFNWWCKRIRRNYFRDPRISWKFHVINQDWLFFQIIMA